MKCIKNQFLVCGLFLLPFLVKGQTGSIEGVVKDSTGKVLEAIIITVQYSNINTLTDSKGYYMLKNIPVGNFTLVASQLGYTMSTKQVLVKENAIEKVDFQLESKANELNGVTINGVITISGMGHVADVHDGV